MQFSDLREEIEELDHRIVDLLEQRVEAAGKLATVARQRGVCLPAHHAERETLRRVVKIGGGTFTAGELREIYRGILSACDRVQNPEPPTVTCLGPGGSFAHLAASRCFWDRARYDFVSNTDEVFDKLRTRQADYGVVTVENSINGPLAENFDLLARDLDDCSRDDVPAPLTICGEVSLEVQYCLLGVGSIGEIKSIHSHQRALDQCRTGIARVIEEHRLRDVQLVPASSTSAAAERAVGDRTIAAIAHRLSAKLWTLNVLREKMEDDATNTTRFAVLGRGRPEQAPASRTWIWFRTTTEPGSLIRSLVPIAEHNLNMTLILPRPVKHEPEAHSFFAVCDGHVDDPPFKEALQVMKASCLAGCLKVLGSYPQEREFV